MMKPSELMNRYRNLVITLDDGSTMTIDAHRYRMRGYNLKPDAEAVKDKLIEHFEKMLRAEEKAERPKSPRAPVALTFAPNLRRLRPQLALTYYGKGSPETIAIALHLVAHYKLYDKHLDVRLGLRNYCDAYMGLDCNGFVGNYAQAIGSTLTPSTYIGDFAKELYRRRTMETVQPNDVLVWPNYGHIAIIDDTRPIQTDVKGNPTRDCTVVESTAANLTGGGDGLQQSMYRLLSVNKHNRRFTVERPRGGHHTEVYIAPLLPLIGDFPTPSSTVRFA